MTTATPNAKPQILTIASQELRQKIEADESFELIDVRSPAEFRSAHVSAARNIPLDELDVEAVKALRDEKPGCTLYVVCQSGGRSEKACAALAAAGVDAVCVEGGTPACEQAGLPIKRSKGAISIERQVRIGAGALVAIGAALGAFVSPWFLVVPAFVGCGLVFAGVTDTCGMGLMLARMPWNR